MKINNPLIRKIGATTLGVLLLIYICYHAFLVNYKGLATETAIYAERSDSIQTTGWIVRNEDYLLETGDGVLNYKVSDGEKIARGDVIADIYADEESATSQSRISRLDTEISNLEMLKNLGDYYSSNADLIGSQINTSIGSILTLSKMNEYENFYTERDHLQYLLNQKRVIVGKESADSYQKRIDELTAEKSTISASASGRTGYIVSPDAGYFISKTDGYENAFSIEDMAKISVSDISNVKNSQTPESAIGKISKDFNWNIVCTIDEQQKIKLEGVTHVKIEIPLVTAEQIPATVIAVNKDEESGNYAVALECDYMNPEIAAIRNEAIEIVVAKYSGVLVKQKAIRFNQVVTKSKDEKGNVVEQIHENIKGVYVKYGQRINFVQVFSDVTVNGYAVCKLNLRDSEKELLVTDSTIQLYDEVVIEGTNLYDGKLL